MWPWAQDKAATCQGRLDDDEASPLLLHHKLTAKNEDSTDDATSTNKSGAARYDEDSGPSTLLMLEATAKAPPVVLQSSSSSSSSNKNQGRDGCQAVVDAVSDNSSSSALVMLVAMKEQQGGTMKEDMDEKQATNPWQRYNRALETNPYFVKSITAFFILALGDLCGQAVEQQRWHDPSSNTANSSISTSFVVDWPRTLRFGLLGLVGAPWSHLYFLYLDKYLPPTPSQPCSWITMFKLVIDQGLQAPLILAVTIGVLAVLKGTTTLTSVTAARTWAATVAANVKMDMQANYWTSLVANCKSCTNDLYVGIVSSMSHGVATATGAAFDNSRHGAHAVFGFNNNSMTAYHGGGGGGASTTYYSLHEHCYQHCLSSRSLQHLALDIVTGKLWVPASLVNLAFVKPTLRVLYVNVVFFAWTIILSMILNNGNGAAS
jgi:Mpv17 / PMP22 family